MHTQGPWVPETDMQGKPCVVTQDKPFEHVCTISNVNTPMKELHANTRLIAASPELLEAAIQALAYLKTLNQCDPLLRHALESAIHKANGGVSLP
jgi:hypothetical protein